MLRWRTDLGASKEYWHGWFHGMSDAFLNARVPKLLVVAGMDRLDRALTAGHMQGRYELQVLYNTGHFVHEDSPDEFIAVVVGFLRRHNVIPPAQVGEVMESAMSSARPRAGSFNLMQNSRERGRSRSNSASSQDSRISSSSERSVDMTTRISLGRRGSRHVNT